ncbi:MAG TPA: hypothetical protein VIK10_07920 [Prolixibacteraceae bacterium]
MEPQKYSLYKPGLDKPGSSYTWDTEMVEKVEKAIGQDCIRR